MGTGVRAIGGTRAPARVGVHGTEGGAALEDVICEEAHLSNRVARCLRGTEDEVIEVGTGDLTRVRRGGLGEGPQCPEDAFLGEGDVTVSRCSGGDVVKLHIRGKVDRRLEGGGIAVAEGIGDGEVRELSAAGACCLGRGSGGLGLAGTAIRARNDACVTNGASLTGTLGYVSVEGALRTSGETGGDLSGGPGDIHGNNVRNLGRTEATKVYHGVLNLKRRGVGDIRAREGICSHGTITKGKLATHDHTLLLLLLLVTTVLAVAKALLLVLGTHFLRAFAFLKKAACLGKGVLCISQTIFSGHVMHLPGDLKLLHPYFKYPIF